MAAETLKHGAMAIDPFRIGRPAVPLVVGKTAVGLMVALLLLFAANTSALACAGGFMQAFLFHKYPEAKATATAIAEARMRGALKGVEWSKSSGKSLHAWRSERTKLTIQALQKRLNSTENSSEILVDTNVFLLNEFTWLKITTEAVAHPGGNTVPCIGNSRICKNLSLTQSHRAITDVGALNKTVAVDGKQIAVSRQPYGLTMSEPKVFTSRRVIDHLLDGAITWQQAIDQGLITSRCGANCSSDKRYGLLGLAIATPQQQARASVK